MNLKKLVPILALGIVPANATVIFIDDFNASQTVFAGPIGPNPVSSQSGVAVGSNVLGGARSLEVTRTSGTSIDFGTVGLGSLTMALAPADSGFASLIWDGDTNGTLNQNGIVPVDLTDAGSNTAIALSVRSDLVAPIILTFYSGNGNSSTYSFNTPAQGFGATPFTDYVIAMSSFVTSSGTGANFTGITAATLFIDGQFQPGLDVEVQNYQAMNPIPEPASFGLVAAGLAGLFIRRHRKQ
jgi:hypothetical protein